MKNSLIASIAIIGFSCTTTVPEKQPSREDVIKNNITVYLQDKLDDPESYEFVSLILVDSTTFLDNINSRRNNFVEDTTTFKIFTNSLLLPSKEKNIYAQKIEISKRIIVKIDSIQVKLGNRVNHIASYKYILKYRSKNQMGAKTLNEYILQTTGEPNFDIIHMTNDPEKLFYTPNEFPGYIEMVTAEYDKEEN